MDSQESNLRAGIVAVLQRLDRKDLICAADGNASCRAGEDLVLITPGGMSKSDIAGEDLMLADLDGNIIRGSRKPSSELGMHLQVYRKRPDVNAVVHAHPPLATAMTLAGFPFNSKVLPELWIGLGPVPTAPYATPATDEVARSIEPLIEKHQAILLERHGALAVGKSLSEACARMEQIEHAAKVFFYSALLEGRKAPAAMAPSKIKLLEETFGLG